MIICVAARFLGMILGGIDQIRPLSLRMLYTTSIAMLDFSAICSKGIPSSNRAITLPRSKPCLSPRSTPCSINTSLRIHLSPSLLDVGHCCSCSSMKITSSATSSSSQSGCSDMTCLVMRRIVGVILVIFIKVSSETELSLLRIKLTVFIYSPSSIFSALSTLIFIYATLLSSFCLTAATALSSVRE